MIFNMCIYILHIFYKKSIDKFNKLVLVNGDDKIIWIVGMRLDRRFSVSDGSKKIIDIKIDND